MVETPINFEDIQKILVIQFAPFGDVLLTTSYFETLKKKIPAAKIYYLVKSPYQKIVRNHPFIDEIMVIRRESGIKYFFERIRTILAVRKEKFDLVIDQQNKPSSQQIAMFSGAEHRVGYADGRLSFAYTLKAGRRELQYSASRKFDILEPLSIDEEPYQLYFHVDEDARNYIENWLEQENLNRQKLICISPGSPVPKKKWNLKNYARLADLIHKKLDFTIILLWAPNELEDVKFVESIMETNPVVAPATDLWQAAALLKKSELLICNDGGLNHLSVATQTPSLAIFGNTDPTVWSPASAFPEHYHLYNPDGERDSENSFGITPEEAFENVNQILNS